jgi:hypothetical protein
MWSNLALSEGSRTLYPSTYDPTGSRAALDLQGSQSYLNRVRREGFHYVYAAAGEYITVASSNRINNGDIEIFNPQNFGTRGDETTLLPANFSCAIGSSEIGTHYFGPGIGYIGSRSDELDGPRALSLPTGLGYSACGYEVPETGIYGVRFGTANTGGGPNGSIGSVPASQQTAEAWDITVRANDTSTTDIDGRVFSYAFLGYTGGNSRPVFHTLYYVTSDGYRYRQDLRGLDPNGYALYANTFGFLDDNQPLYKTLRGNNYSISNLPLQVTTQAADFPIFYSDVMDPAIEPEVEAVLLALGIPATPPSPTITNVSFSGAVSGSITATGVGGDFSFDTTGTVSYEIVISFDGADFSAANAQNRVLTGIAYAGSHIAIWDGLDNSLQPFPPGNYSFRAAGRAGEVHFPIIDAENNDTAASSGTPGGGPTIERLNGLSLVNAREVFFDDRGYVTSSGELIGTLNGDLCGPGGSNSATPNEALDGIDSLTRYRAWQSGRNRNRDCASGAGWGDAKAVNLWTYYLTEDELETLQVIESTVDLATSVVMPDSVVAGATVQGTVSFSNFGTSTASNVSYTLSLDYDGGTILGSVTVGNLPSGWTSSYNNVSGEVTFTPNTTDLSDGVTYTGITFSYTAPSSGPVIATSTISYPGPDDVDSNNTSTASTAIGGVDVSAEVNGVPALVEPGETVSGAVVFSSIGTDDANGVAYVMQINASGTLPADITFTNLPGGAVATYDANTGTVTFSGLPATFLAGNTQSLNFEFASEVAEAVSYQVTAIIDTTDTDANPANNSDDGSTVTGYSAASILIDASAICENDVPYIVYDITAQGFTPNNLATVEFVEIASGTVVDTYLDQPLTGGKLLWPGATVDSSGNGTAWPGWDFSGGVWTQVPSMVRPEVEVRISVNPTNTVTLSYPPATPACVAEPPPGRAAFTATVAPPVAKRPTPVPLLPPLGLAFLTLFVGLAGAYNTRRKS